MKLILTGNNHVIGKGRKRVLVLVYYSYTENKN